MLGSCWTQQRVMNWTPCWPPLLHPLPQWRQATKGGQGEVGCSGCSEEGAPTQHRHSWTQVRACGESRWNTCYASPACACEVGASPASSGGHGPLNQYRSTATKGHTGVRNEVLTALCCNVFCVPWYNLCGVAPIVLLQPLCSVLWRCCSSVCVQRSTPATLRLSSCAQRSSVRTL